MNDEEENVFWDYFADAMILLLPPLAFVGLMIGAFWWEANGNLFGDWGGSISAYVLSLIAWMLMLLAAHFDEKHS